MALNAGANEKGDSRACKTRERGGKRKRARTALCRILLRQPKRIDREICSAESQEEKAGEEPGQRLRAKIENFSKRECDEREHEREVKPQRAATPEFLGEPRHGQAAQNCCKRNQHCRPRSKPRRLWANCSGCFCQRCDSRRNVNRPCPQSANGCQHVQRIQNRSPPQRPRKERRKRLPNLPGTHHIRFRLPARRLCHSMTHPRQQKSRQSTQRKHHAPSVAAEVGADSVVENRGQKSSDIISRVHVPRTDAAPTFRPLFGHKRSTHGPFAADADSRKQPQNRQLPNSGNDRAEKSEKGIPHNRQHQRPNATELISHRPPQKRWSPPKQKQRKQQSAVKADVAFRGGNS